MSRTTAPTAYLLYRLSWPIVALAALLFVRHSVLASSLLAVIGLALLCLGVYLLLDVDEFSDRTARHLREQGYRRMTAMFPGWGWRVHGAVLMLAGVIALTRAAVG